MGAPPENEVAPTGDVRHETSSIEKQTGGETDDGPPSYGEVESAGFDEGRTKKLLRKTDKVLLPFLALLYLLSFLDRTNIGNARLAGIEEDLGMAGLDYNVSLSQRNPTPSPSDTSRLLSASTVAAEEQTSKNPRTS